jgi:hypothetical protein
MGAGFNFGSTGFHLPSFVMSGCRPPEFWLNVEVLIARKRIGT